MTGFLTILLTGLGAHATLLGDFFHGLWSSSNLAFFPVGLLVAGWLFWTRRQELLEVDISADESTAHYRRVRGDRKTTVIGLVIAVLLVFISQLLHAPHLGWVSLLILLGTIAYSEYGAKGSYSALPILILLFFLKPVPGFFEPWLQLGLQWVVSRFASMLLDFLRIFNYSEGVVLGLVGQEGLADQVCSGVRWLYVAMFAAIAWGIHNRYHWFRIFLNVTQAIFWVVVWNSVRVVVVLANREWGGSWIDSPVTLMVIDYVCLALILFFAWSGDQFFASIVAPQKGETIPIDKEQIAIDKEQGGSNADLAPAWQPSPSVWGLGFGFFFVALMSSRLVLLHGSSWASATVDGSQANIELPAEMDGWKIASLEDEEKPLYDGSVAQVKRWSLEREGKKLTLKVTGPLPVYPDPGWSWRWYGWNTDEAAIADDTGKDVEAPKVSMIKLSRLAGESGAIAACGMDRNGRLLDKAEPWVEASGIIGGWTSALQYVFGLSSLEKARENTLRHPTRSLSLHWESVKPLRPEQLQELSDVFRAILPKLTNRSE